MVGPQKTIKKTLHPHEYRDNDNLYEKAWNSAGGDINLFSQDNIICFNGIIQFPESWN